MLRIAHMIASNFYGGPEKQVINHFLGLNQIPEYQGVLFVFMDSDSSKDVIDVAKKNGIETYSLLTKNRFDFSSINKISRIMSEKQINLLCTHGYKSTVYGYHVARKLGIPVIAYSRGYTGENIKVKFYEWLERKYLDKVDAVIAVSSGQKKKLISYGVKNENIVVIHNAINSNNIFQKETPGQKEKVILLTVGRLSPEKGHMDLLKAMKILKEGFSLIELHICGDGELRERLEGFCVENRINHIVKFMGFCKDVDRYYSNADIFVLPSYTEGLPNVILEAYNHELPVVATRVGGVPEIVDDKLTGFLVEPGDYTMMAQYLGKLISDRKLRNQMGRKGKNKIIEKFNFKIQLKKTLEVYKHILDKKSELAVQ